MTIRLLLPAAIFTSLISCGQIRGARTILGEEFAKVELEQSLTDKKLHNVVDNKKEIISDSVIAIGIAEKILFKICGQGNIEKQRPYEICKIKNYWSISGTLPRGMNGGTFLIILDAMDGRLIRISHGK